jgi:dihydrofolate reductase
MVDGGRAGTQGGCRQIRGGMPMPAWRKTDRPTTANVALATDEFPKSAESVVVCHPSPETRQRMTSLILKMSVSLDGYVAPADGSSDWEAAGRSPDGAEWVLDTVSNAGAHLVGAVTYARWAGSWPGASGPFAAPMNEIPKVVFSNALTSADWGETTIATGDLVDAVARLKRERLGGYLLALGGVRFARSLVETGLIDEYRLVVQPVVLGAGERLFTAPLTIEPVSTTAFSAGAVAHVFTTQP